jgi:oxygen-dependent protoporphyrinogen oxidase
MNLGAYGFLVARGERPALLGCQYESTVFPGRAPTGHVLLRAIVGGTFDPGIVDRPDTEIVDSVIADLGTAAGLSVRPSFTRVWRHRNVLPQYELGHERLARAVDDAITRLPGLRFTGMGVRGMGLSDCIRDAAALARAL